MRKISKPWLKLGILSVFLLFLLIWYHWELPCIPRLLTGIPCPTCGLTRAWLWVLRLELKAAFLQYPMFWAVPVLILYLLLDGKLFPGRRMNILFPVILIAGILLVWLARVFGFLGALSPL